MDDQSGWIYQAGTIAIKRGRVCLVESANHRRWVIPKGCLEPGKSLGEIVLQEAWEEAGLVGLLDPEPLGSYLYSKWGTVCHVTVYLMRVTGAVDRYPEQQLRRRIWLKPSEAAGRLHEKGLRDILLAATRASRKKLKR